MAEGSEHILKRIQYRKRRHTLYAASLTLSVATMLLGITGTFAVRGMFRVASGFLIASALVVVWVFIMFLDMFSQDIGPSTPV